MVKNVKVIKKGMLSYYGHVLRKDIKVSFFREKTIQGTMPGHRRRGRPWIRWEYITRWTILKGLRSAEDRRLWSGRCDTWEQLHVIHPQSRIDVFKYFVSRRVIHCWNTALWWKFQLYFPIQTAIVQKWSYSFYTVFMTYLHDLSSLFSVYRSALCDTSLSGVYILLFLHAC